MREIQAAHTGILPAETLAAAEDGGIFVFPAGAPLDLSGELTCDWRDGDLW